MSQKFNSYDDYKLYGKKFWMLSLILFVVNGFLLGALRISVSDNCAIPTRLIFLILVISYIKILRPVLFFLFFDDGAQAALYGYFTDTFAGADDSVRPQNVPVLRKSAANSQLPSGPMWASAPTGLPQIRTAL